MPFLTVKLTPPGVHVEQTKTLLQAVITESNLIRFRGGLAEKLGGWTRYFPTALPGVIRQLWPWADYNSIVHVAAAGDQGLGVITDGAFEDISPYFVVDNIPPNFSTTAGTPLVTINDPDSIISNNLGSVDIVPSVSVGGIVLYGSYAVSEVASPGVIDIVAATNATSTVVNGGAVPSFTTIAGEYFVKVTLPSHGLSAGGTFALGVPTTVGGITLSGFYEVLEPVDADTFTIAASATAASSDTASENGGDIRIVYWLVNAPAPPGVSLYGDGLYGQGTYGEASMVPVIPGGTKVTAANLGMPTLDWSLANFGDQLLAQPLNGPLFKWDPTAGIPQAAPIAAAPPQGTGFFVAMPQQQVVVYGATSLGIQDPMLVAWCDNADYGDWVASTANQAGTYRLTRGSKIVAGIQGPQQAMLWTDVGLWLMTYIGYPDVFGFGEIAQGCGPISKNAVCVCGGVVFWMSFDKFWIFANNAAQPLPCEVWDAIHQNLNLNFADRIRAAANSPIPEIAWYYPSTQSTGENDSYVKYNMLTNEWDYGSLEISEWVDITVAGPPISAMTQPGGTTSLIMQHELSPDADGEPLSWWFRTGYFQLSEAEDFIFVDRVRPDFKWSRFDQPETVSAAVDITLYTQDEPDNPLKPPAVFGPFACTNASGPFDPRARGRLFSMMVAGDDLGSFVRMGGVKLRFSTDGRQG